MKRYMLATLLAVAITAVLLAGFFPAAWAWRLAGNRVAGLHLKEVHGSVWDGRAEGVEYAGIALGRVHWTLSRTLVFGRMDLRLAVDGPLARGVGRLRRQGDVLIGQNLHVLVDAGRVPVSLGSSGMRPRGTVVVNIARVRIRDEWPQHLHGRIVWRDAALADRQDSVALGELHADLSERAGSVLEARLSDAGGPLALSGTVQVSTLGWRMNALLRARAVAPNLHRALAQLGPVNEDGTLLLQRQGGLMMGEQP